MKEFSEAYWEAFRWTILIILSFIALLFVGTAIYHVIHFALGEYTPVFFGGLFVLFGIPAIWVFASKP